MAQETYAEAEHRVNADTLKWVKNALSTLFGDRAEGNPATKPALTGYALTEEKIRQESIAAFKSFADTVTGLVGDKPEKKATAATATTSGPEVVTSAPQGVVGSPVSGLKR